MLFCSYIFRFVLIFFLCLGFSFIHTHHLPKTLRTWSPVMPGIPHPSSGCAVTEALCVSSLVGSRAALGERPRILVLDPTSKIWNQKKNKRKNNEIMHH
jgi:hypothetical protein